MRKFLFAALAVFAGLSCTDAFAGSMVSEPLDHPPSVVVGFHDLNLTKETDARELLDRITHAARQACGPRPDATGLHLMDRWEDCVNDAMGHAIARIHSPALNRVAAMAGRNAHLAAAAN